MKTILPQSFAEYMQNNILAWIEVEKLSGFSAIILTVFPLRYSAVKE